MFSTTSRWGFLRKVYNVISCYERGVITLKEALEKLSALYGSSIKQYFTYDGNGKKVAHTCIEFGCPVVAQYVF